jgi:hypothetical protein
LSEMTQKQFALARGWSESYVSKLKRQGRLVMTAAGLVNVEATDRLVANTADPARGGDRTAGALPGDPMAAETPAGAAGAARGSSGSAGKGSLEQDAGYRSAATRERLAKARIAELELAELAGALVRRDDVERLVFALARMAMDKMLAIPERLGGQLAVETDVARCEQLLETELRDACDSMTRVDKLLMQDDDQAAAA